MMDGARTWRKSDEQVPGPNGETQNVVYLFLPDVGSKIRWGACLLLMCRIFEPMPWCPKCDYAFDFDEQFSPGCGTPKPRRKQ